MGLCDLYNAKTQEFARIIYVDNLKDHKPAFEDYRPLENRPAYESQNVLKIVSFVTIDRKKVIIFFRNYFCSLDFE